MDDKSTLLPIGRKGASKPIRNPKTKDSVLIVAAVFITILFVHTFVSISKRSPLFEERIQGISRSDPYKIFQDDPLLDRIGIPDLNPSKEHLHKGKKAMVASDVPLCSTMGKEILLKGGNAADAAVTVALCIGSINSHSSGIGGGGFIVSKNKEDYLSIDAREMAPHGAFKEMYGDNFVLSKVGGLAIAIPGELKGLFELFTRHGSKKLSWKQLLDPVIKLNREGFPCSKVFKRVIDIENEVVFSRVPEMKSNWDFIFNKHNEVINEGDWITRPNYADTLQLIANNGSAAIFYDPEGPIVKSLVDTIRQFGGIITKDDFSRYEVNVERPINVNISIGDRDLSVHSSNGVSCGLALVAGLNFFNEIHNKTEITTDEQQVLLTHKLIESFKWLSSIRSSFGDVQVENYKQGLIDKYTSKDWIHEILQNGNYSDKTTFPWKNYDPQYELTEPKGTSHFSIIDEDDNAIGMTTTVNLLFGSLVYDNNTGIILNNEMDDFSQPNVPNAFNLTPSIYNFIGPYKRPLSSTAPTIITDQKTGRPDLLIGAAGGSRIPTAILQAIIRVYYENKPLLESISFPRLHHQLIPEVAMVENITIFSEEHGNNGIIDKLHKLGHDWYESGSLTAMNGIHRNGDTLEGVSDYWRKRGEADGY
ncbi:gamma-glutamyltransferase [Scheffersomyces xylosifermentans]|uniref:gamma-glutamyltransferase n=1 Tax=Scheffersomyces xylosifermentans TaxID=1304137 RepID=UPI00315CC3A3